MPSELRLSIDERGPFVGGHGFGDAGRYERITGTAHFRVDPSAPGQRGVTDIDFAPRDADGMVGFSADFFILKPLDLARGRRRLLFEYVNRGDKRAVQYFNDAPSSNDLRKLGDTGNGFLFRRGHSIVWLGWQGDLYAGGHRLRLHAPVARQSDGSPITGMVTAEFVPIGGELSFPLSSIISTEGAAAASLDTSTARLTRRRFPHSARELIPQGAWSFARFETGEAVSHHGEDSAVIPSDRHIYVPGGFEAGWIYELVYLAKDPRVLGLAHVAVRNFISSLKHDEADAAGRPNPLRGGVEKAYAWGRSQSGRCIRDFIYNGYNGDESGRRVFDGVMAHVAGAGKMWMNHRFANLALLPGQDFENHHTPADRFPFSYARSRDHLTGKEDAILKRPETDPLVIHSDSCSEYWQRRGSLAHTDTEGNDLPQPDTVRMYLWSSSQHAAAAKVKSPAKGLAQNFKNTVSTTMFFRNNLDALDRWATTGAPPPPSRIPARADGTLVSPEEWRRQFPQIPAHGTPAGPSRLELLDFGPEIDKGVISAQPLTPIPGKEYVVQVPAVDADGNDRAGVRAPTVAAPLGTFPGWNLRRAEFGRGTMLGVAGSYIPFPASAEERALTGDPRLSIDERYPSQGAYTAAVRTAAEALCAAGYILQEDVDRAVADSANWGSGHHVPHTPSPR